MKRNDDGRKWAQAYLLKLRPTQPPAELHCPDHAEVRLIRILGGTWICTECARTRPGRPGD